MSRQHYVDKTTQALKEADQYQPGTPPHTAHLARAQVYATLAAGMDNDLIHSMEEQTRQARAREHAALKKLERAEEYAQGVARLTREHIARTLEQRHQGKDESGHREAARVREIPLPFPTQD